RCAHCHLSKPTGGREKCGADRQLQTHAAARDADFSARLPPQSRGRAIAKVAARDHRRRKTSPPSRENIRRTIPTARVRRLRTDRDFTGDQHESSGAAANQTWRTSPTIESARFGWENGSGHCGGNPRTGNRSKTLVT